MRVGYTRAALAVASAGGLALGGLAGAAPALASPITVQVPCSVNALSDAITNAVDGDVLQLARNCTYTLVSALPGVGVDLAIHGTRSTIERSYAGATPAFSLLVVATGGSLAVTNVNFTNGDSNYGGAIQADRGPLSVTGGTFTGNYASANGGAIYSNAGVTVSGATFTGNSAAIYSGALEIDDGGTVTGSTFTGNTADYGGVIEVYDDRSLTLNKSTLLKNSAEYGGAIETDNGGSNLTVNNGYFQQNVGSEYAGGGIYNDGGLTLNNSAFSYNKGTYDGGGVYNDGTATVNGATFKGNTAEDGGGWYNEDVLTMTGGSFSNNTAEDGAGLYNVYEATIDTSTLQQNTASDAGGGLYEDGTVAHLSNSKIVYNHAPTGEGGGIYNNDTVTLTGTTVRFNTVNNCSSAASVTGCTG